MANVTVDQGEVDRLSALTQFKKVTAPYDGTIIERRIDIGNLVTAGSTSNTTLLYRMAQDDPMRVFVDAPQSVAADMTVGLLASMTANDLPNRSFRGTITRNGATRSTRKHARFASRSTFPTKDSTLVPGMYVEVAFQLKARGRSRCPPRRWCFAPAGPQVAVVGANGRVAFHTVQIARDDGNVVEIGSGVEPGDRVVLNISNEIADGNKVAVTGEQGTGATTAAR